MISISKSIHIARGVDDVWAYVTQAGNASAWQAGVVEDTSDGELAVGTTGTVTKRFMGRDVEDRTECVEYHPPRRVAWATTGGPVEFTATNDLSESDGGTEFTITVQGELGGLLKLAEGMVTRQIEGSLEGNLLTLKSNLEG